jgi:hypothetical protein
MKVMDLVLSFAKIDKFSLDVVVGTGVAFELKLLIQFYRLPRLMKSHLTLSLQLVWLFNESYGFSPIFC